MLKQRVHLFWGAYKFEQLLSHDGSRTSGLYLKSLQRDNRAIGEIVPIVSPEVYKRLSQNEKRSSHPETA
jgi:hypothetical protein